jgi:thiamine phosphate synthase YjbQ (UPF0047 family)
MILLKNFYVDTTKGIDLITIGHEVRQVIREGKVEAGEVMITIPHPGAAVVAMEPDAKWNDIKKGLESFLGNSLICCLLAKSLVMPVEKGKMPIEPWQEIFLIDYETSGKRREFRVQLFWEQKEVHEPEF